MSDNQRWAIRDIRLGKTYFFRNWKDMVAFVNDRESKKPVLLRKDNSNG